LVAVDLGLDAKQRLIKAGLEIFGTFNLEGATTRQLAERAGVNQAAIAYYFGGKEGLYFAVIEHVITHKASRVRPVLLQISKLLEQKQLTPEEAVNQIKTLFAVYLQVLLDDKAATTWARILMREQMQPTKAFYLLYERWIRHVHETLAALLAVILQKRSTDPNVILRTHILVGQIQIFLSGRETIRRRVNWEGYDESARKQIQKAVFDQLDLFLQPLVRSVPLILQGIANQGADLANIGVVDGNQGE
jgi:TetR/AcrR family transcriptional regulator, regulator of cefoperazone and chloramphenicol sensitivity